VRARIAEGLRWLGGRRLVLPLTARLLCARQVSSSRTFLLRELLRRPGTHLYRLRESGVEVALRHTGVDAATLAEVFYQRFYDPPEPVAQALGAPVEIVDLGANIGMFGAFAAGRWPAARIVAYEPDPANAALHERTIEANDRGPRWMLVKAAAGTRDGEARFVAGLHVGSHLLAGDALGADSAISVPVRDVLAQIAAADLVKMDIEGGEWSILSDPRFASDPPKALVLEYHPRRDPDETPAAAVDRLLHAAGLRTQTIWRAEDGHGMVWAWRA
jgi:FkbM family methyltransferase